MQYITEADDNLAATITAHHLVINRDSIVDGGLKPHYYCMPIAKAEEHRLAVRAAAVSGNKKFFFGSDSAPHPQAAKESARAAAGCFTATNAMSILAHVFEEEGALDKLEGFASRYGAAFYKSPINEETITLTKSDTPGFPSLKRSKATPVLSWSLIRASQSSGK